MKKANQGANQPYAGKKFVSRETTSSVNESQPHIKQELSGIRLQKVYKK